MRIVTEELIPTFGRKDECITDLLSLRIGQNGYNEEGREWKCDVGRGLGRDDRM